MGVVTLGYRDRGLEQLCENLEAYLDNLSVTSTNGVEKAASAGDINNFGQTFQQLLSDCALSGRFSKILQ